jgi:hypothetical protein
MEDDLSGLRRLIGFQRFVYSIDFDFQKGSPTHVN